MTAIFCAVFYVLGIWMGYLNSAYFDMAVKAKKIKDDFDAVVTKFSGTEKFKEHERRDKSLATALKAVEACGKYSTPEIMGSITPSFIGDTFALELLEAAYHIAHVDLNG